MNIDRIRKLKPERLWPLDREGERLVAPIENHLLKQFAVRGIALADHAWHRGYSKDMPPSYMSIVYQFPLLPLRNGSRPATEPMAWVAPWYWHNHRHWRDALAPVLDALERLSIARRENPSWGVSRPIRIDAYRTDLIGRLAIDAYGADVAPLLSFAPHYLRSPSLKYRSGPIDHEIREHILVGSVEASCLPVGFPDCSCDLDANRFSFMSLRLRDDIEIRSDLDFHFAIVGIGEKWPDTVLQAVEGQPLHRVIGHPALEDPRIVVRSARINRLGNTEMVVKDPAVPLVGPLHALPLDLPF